MSCLVAGSSWRREEEELVKESATEDLDDEASLEEHDVGKEDVDMLGSDISSNGGEESGEVATSWGWVVFSPLGGERMPLALKLAEPGLEVDTLLGVKRREVVGGPPAFSLPHLEEFMFSFRRPGPLNCWDRTGV